MHVNVCVHAYESGAHRNQRCYISSELELQVIVSNRMWVLWIELSAFGRIF